MSNKLVKTIINHQSYSSPNLYSPTNNYNYNLSMSIDERSERFSLPSPLFQTLAASLSFWLRLSDTFMMV